MKRKLISSISLIVAFIMILGVLASCNDPSDPEQSSGTDSGSVTSTTNQNSEGSESGNDQSSTTSANGDSSSTPNGNTSPEGSDTNAPEGSNTNAPEGSDTNAPEETTKPKDQSSLEVQNDTLVQMSNSLANGVQAYFTDASRTHYSIQNLEMTMNYARSYKAPQLVESIKNTQGVPYIQNTMDVFVRMNSGNTYYASGSTKSAEANLYRFGYYYYQGLFEFQNFAAKEYNLGDPNHINLRTQFTSSYKQQIQPNYVRDANGDIIKDENGIITYFYEILEPEEGKSADPYFSFKNNFSYATADNNAIVIVAKTVGSTTGAQFWVDTGNDFDPTQSTNIYFVNDGEFHAYYISLDKLPGYTDATTLKGIRFDPNGEVGDGLVIQSITLGKAMDYPASLSINRHFHVYSNKMHHAIQFAVTQRTEDIKEVGMLTEIATSTVSKLMIVTKDDKTYTSLDAGFSWDDVVAVGFDVTEAGIFGFILPDDPAAGNIKVTEKDGMYVIEQTRTPVLADGTEGVIIPSINTEKKDENDNYIHADGVKNNGNDFYLAQRVYTDENHDFAEFLKETGFERHPLISQRVSISEFNSDGASFDRYDPIRGIYILKIATPIGGFYAPYNNPQKNYKVNFQIRSDIDRDIYIMTSGSSGLLECATLMDKDMMLLPVPIEVIKNFSEATGERNLYNIDDPTFSEAIFCLSLSQNVRYTYTLINLYQNWGNFPLKQLSQIPFHCPYYHLSTGVTETNCILPWLGMVNVGKTNSSTLPDFRSMSAPYWKSQPQHNSSGAHTWLKYTDADGNTYMSECKENIITSYGPTYAEVVWHNLSDDGKIKITYTHMEMPQTDENRTYYTMEYEFLEDLTINNFKDNFVFYEVTDNNPEGTYKKIGYLDENNEYQVIDSNQDETAVPEKILGDDCPYFSFFMMPDWYRDNGSAEGYSNVAFLIYNSSFKIGGVDKDYNFLIKNPKDYVSLTLNEAGTIEFKAGDKITINAILLPWGSQEYEDDPANRLNAPHSTGYTEYTYSTVLPDGTLYMDKNVRDVRENTLLNPLTATSTTDEVLDSPFLPKIKSKDGKTATFTISGGINNVTIRVYGFEKLTNPKVEILDENGNWVEYVISSKNNPVHGLYHYYDGYMVNYDEDGTYSYSFVTDMTNAESKTFRVSAYEDFAGWPSDPTAPENENLLNIYTDPEELQSTISAMGHFFSKVEMHEFEDAPGTFYASVYVSSNKDIGESYCTLYDSEAKDNMGQYLVVKYRVPNTNSEPVSGFQFFTSTTTNNATEAGNFSYTPVMDGEWHVVVFDLSKAGLNSYIADGSGNYTTRLLRFDIFNKSFNDPDVHIDFAYIGIDSDLREICKLEEGKFETIDFVEGGQTNKLNVETAEVIIKTYLDPESGYTQSTLAYGSVLDYINGVKPGASSAGSKGGGVTTINGIKLPETKTLFVQGWCCVEGGIQKYVYSIDGGKTWKDCAGTPIDVTTANNDAILTTAEGKAGPSGFQFSDREASRTNGRFQNDNGLTIDLNGVEGKVDVIFAAVPVKEPTSLVLLFCMEEINCSEKPAPVDTAFDHNDIAEKVNGLSFFGSSEVKNENGVDYVDIYGKVGTTEKPIPEAYVTLFTSLSSAETGKYLVIKYRVPSDNKESVGNFQFFTSTAGTTVVGSECFNHSLVEDGEWHVEVIDLSKISTLKFTSGSDGTYSAKFLRFDIFNKEFTNEDTHINIAYAGIYASIEDICEMEKGGVDTLTLFEGSKQTKIDVNTATAQNPYLDPSSGYTVATDVPFASAIDYINGVYINKGNNSSENGVTVINGCTVSRVGTLLLQGWCCADGGVEKYVYSIDGGKTWTQLIGTADSAGDAVYNAAQSRSGVTFADQVNSRTNGSFQAGSSGKGLTIDLSAQSGSIDITVAAVPKAATDKLILLYVLEEVNCDFVSILDENSEYEEILIDFGSQVDSVNEAANIKANGSAMTMPSYTSVTTYQFTNKGTTYDYAVRLKGWSVVEGGVSKYVWTADGGQTWNDCQGHWYEASDAMITSGSNKSNVPLTNDATTKKNGGWQGDGLIIDLSAYKDSTEPLDIYVCAVLDGSTDKVIVLYHLDDVTITPVQ